MTNEEIKLFISAHIPAAIYEETGEFLNAIIPSEELLPIMKEMRSNRDLNFDYLFCLTCIDWKDHLMMVYHLTSKKHKHTLVIKAKITDVNDPKIETVSGIWKTAIFHEREVYDLFGVTFLNHPDLRRLFLMDDWEGWPLRKNYVDENMIEI